ncbi:MAG: response regulator [Candidatus Eremiobacteraeota bacterium]|nr:response regulator [Candidatus Eremiobacteraeota bacterium]
MRLGPYCLKVLVVDDDQNVASVLSRLLRHLGCEVTTYVDSRAALEAFIAAPQTFDLLFTDQEMPELRGPELIRRCRAERPELVVIIGSGMPLSETLTDCLFLRKPYQLEGLRKALDWARSEVGPGADASKKR